MTSVLECLLEADCAEIALERITFHIYMVWVLYFFSQKQKKHIIDCFNVSKCPLCSSAHRMWCQAAMFKRCGARQHWIVNIKNNFTYITRIFLLFKLKINEGDNSPSTSVTSFAQLLFHYKPIPFTSSWYQYHYTCCFHYSWHKDITPLPDTKQHKIHTFWPTKQGQYTDLHTDMLSFILLNS